MRRGERTDWLSGRGWSWELLGALGIPLKPVRPISLVLGVPSRQEQVLEWGFCQASTMKGAESVCKGEIITIDSGH